MCIHAFAALLCFPVQQKYTKSQNVGPPKLLLSSLYASCQTIKINLKGMSLLGSKSERAHMGS